MGFITLVRSQSHLSCRLGLCREAVGCRVVTLPVIVAEQFDSLCGISTIATLTPCLRYTKGEVLTKMWVFPLVMSNATRIPFFSSSEYDDLGEQRVYVEALPNWMPKTPRTHRPMMSSLRRILLPTASLFLVTMRTQARRTLTVANSGHDSPSCSGSIICIDIGGFNLFFLITLI